jgi:putative transposase
MGLHFISFSYYCITLEKWYKIGAILIRMHRELPAMCKLKQVSVTPKADGWYIQMTLEDSTIPELAPDQVIPTWLGG